MKHLSFLLCLFSVIFLSSCGGSSSTSSGCTTCKTFVTNSTYQGNIGTKSSADALCASDANNPGTGTYLALLAYENGSRRACSTADCSGGMSENNDWTLKPSTTYTRQDGTIIGTTTTSALFTYPLTHSFGTTGVYVWTGLYPNWTTPSEESCANWTSTASGSPPGGMAGFADHTDLTALHFGINCNQNAHLICVEQ